MTAPSPVRARQGRTHDKVASTLVTAGALAFVTGTVVAIWAWNLPFGQDPYTTYLDSEPGRADHAIRTAVRGAVVAGLGLSILVSGLVARHVRRRSGHVAAADDAAGEAPAFAHDRARGRQGP